LRCVRRSLFGEGGPSTPAKATLLRLRASASNWLLRTPTPSQTPSHLETFFHHEKTNFETMSCKSKNFVISIICLFGLFLATLQAQAQARKYARPFESKNTIYLGIDAYGAYPSINYDRIFFDKGRVKYTFGLGFAVWQTTKYGDVDWATHVPVQLNAFFGSGNHHPEVGIGFTYRYMNTTPESLYEKYMFPVKVGYSYQRPEGGLFLRADLLAVYRPDEAFTPNIYPSFGFGIGYTLQYTKGCGCF